MFPVSIPRIIKNKISQKNFYQANQIPTSACGHPKPGGSAPAQNPLPAVHKLATGGYDGQGVQIINREEEIGLGFDAPAVLEQKIGISQEISIIIAVDQQGNTAIYPRLTWYSIQN